MNFISEYILKIYNKQKTELPSIIDINTILDAKKVLDTMQIHNTYSIFYYLSAVNLLNTAIKISTNRNILNYSYVKGKAKAIVEYLILCKKFDDVAYFYNKEEKCLYISVYELIFSFHQIEESYLILHDASKQTPIIWPGIRLQLIALQLYIFAKNAHNNSQKLAIEKNTIINNNDINHNMLISCPECGASISNSAKFCPNCGFVTSRDSEITESIEVGDYVEVQYNNMSYKGIASKLAKTYIEIKLEDETLYRIKYDAIESLSFRKKEFNDEAITIAQAADTLIHIIQLEGKNIEDSIITNATITECGSGRVVAVSDGGKTIQCIAPLGYKRKMSKIGDRIFCNNDCSSGICYFSIVDMPNKELANKFTKGIKSYARNPKSQNYINSIIAYIRTIIQKNESKVVLNQLKKRLKTHFANIGIEEDEKKHSTIETTNLSLQPNSTTATNIQPELYKTEGELTLLKGPKTVGYIDLDAIPEKKGKGIKNEDSFELAKPEKLDIITNASSKGILSGNLPLLSDIECRNIEKELDTLIREGKREECLKRSYEVIRNNRPTPKYFKSYLDRIVNTEIAMDNTEKAIETLSILIAFSEVQNDTKPNNLSHLYISLARLLNKLNKKQEALQALSWASYLFPKNKTMVDNVINTVKLNVEDSNTTKTNPAVSNSISSLSVSKMLIQDVEQYAKSQNSTESEDLASPEALYNAAEFSSGDSTKSFESRAQLFLDAAAAFYNENRTSEKEFQMSIAHYARMKGNSYYTMISNSVQKYPDSRTQLIAECDSAKSYYVEALGLYNDLELKRYLQELLLKYLKIENVLSQVDGGKTPDADWARGTLKSKMKECLVDDNTESQKVLYKTCIAIGSAAERAWNTLANDKDGTAPLTLKLGNIDFRKKAYDLLNSIEQSEISSDYLPGVFLHKLFEHRQKRINSLRVHLDECLSWNFNQFDIESFNSKWNNVIEYTILMTTTDLSAVKAVNDVLATLKQYAKHRENERYRNLVTSQQILLKSQKTIAETTTYYGRVFFSHLYGKWLKEIGRQIEEKDANALPKLEITPDPCYIKQDIMGKKYIDFVVTNNGDSTAESFIVNVTINNKVYKIEHNSELAAGEWCEEQLSSDDFELYQSFDAQFLVISKYQNKEIPPVSSEATYEVEDEDCLADESEIPWTTSNTPREDIFKGREKDLNTLINHYLSNERSTTYILYGLTRTGKSSILDYLRERIEGQSLKDDSNKKIMSFKWYLNEFSYIGKTIGDLWTWALETSIIDVIDREKKRSDLVDIIENTYPKSAFPKPGEWAQSDFTKIIDILNENDIIPLITIDEFSFVRDMLRVGLIDATFISTLRNLALYGKACFIYSGTYDIKDLPKEKDYGIVGQMNNTTPMHINSIDDVYANELIDACPKIMFDDRVKTYIRTMSGCVPYWIQWICKDCGKYAVAHKKKHLGLRDVTHVVNVLTGTIKPDKNDTWNAMDENSFHNNNITPGDIAEEQLFTCLSYLLKDCTPMMGRGISIEELQQLWDKYNVSESKRLKMVNALDLLEQRKVIMQFTDENREVYKFRVELFRCFWYNTHKDLVKILSK